MTLNYKSRPLPITDVTSEGIATQQNLEGKRVQNAINLAGGLRMNGRVLTASGPASSTDGVLYGDTTTGAVDVTLLLAEEYYGQLLGFMQIAGANPYTVSVQGTDTVIDNTGASVTTLTVTTVAVWLHALNDSTWAQVI